MLTGIAAHVVLGCWTPRRCVAQQAPFSLEFSTYLGGSGGENFRDVAVDGDGNIYVTGGTNSFDFPTTPGALDRSFGTGGTALGAGGPMDVFVAKLSNGGQLIWATYVGGPNYDRAYAIEVGPDDSVYIAGRAGPGFPTTPGTIQPVFAGDLLSGAPPMASRMVSSPGFRRMAHNCSGPLTSAAAMPRSFGTWMSIPTGTVTLSRLATYTQTTLM